MKLYYSPGACSLAPHVVLREIDAPFTLSPIRILAAANLAPAGYEQVHPLRRVPVLELDDGTRITEVAAILGFLADAFCPRALLPNEPVLRARAAEWMGFLSSSVHIAFAQIWRAARPDALDRDPDPDAPRAAARSHRELHGARCALGDRAHGRLHRYVRRRPGASPQAAADAAHDTATRGPAHSDRRPGALRLPAHVCQTAQPGPRGDRAGSRSRHLRGRPPSGSTGSAIRPCSLNLANAHACSSAARSTRGLRSRRLRVTEVARSSQPTARPIWSPPVVCDPPTIAKWRDS